MTTARARRAGADAFAPGSAFALVARARSLAARRWVRDNAFALFVMGPLILGGSGLIFQPYLEAALDALRGARGSDAAVSVHAGALAGAALAMLLVARLSGTIRDVYAFDGADHYLDALPIPALTRLHLALATRALKALPVALAALFALALARPDGVPVLAAVGGAAPALLAGAAGLAIVETAVALALVRARVLGALRLAAFALAAAVACGAAADASAWWLAAAPFAAYPLAAFGFARWRAGDRERARTALARARRTGVRFERLADRLVGPGAGARVVRDLRLVRRGFSTVVYVAGAAALLLPALAVWASRRYALGPVGVARAVESATILAAFALAAVTHALARYERPRLWIDVTAGADTGEMPRAKRWVGRLLAAPAAVLGILAAGAAGYPLGGWGAFELVWLTWASSTLASVLCYEVPDRPATGVVFAFLAAAGLPLMFVFTPSLSGVWFLGYCYASIQLFDRAQRRAAALHE